MAQLSGLQGLGGPINYYESMVPDFRREALMETQNRLGQQQVASQQMQNQQAQQENQRRQEFYGAIQNATPDQLPALRRQFPEFAQNIQQEIGIQGAEHAAFVHGALNKLSVAAASGNPQQVQATIQQNAPALASMNVSPEQAIQLYQQDPQKFNGLLNAARLATQPIDKQFDIQADQEKLAETIRSNRAGEGLQARGQDIQIRGQNISASNSAADRQIRLMQLKQDALVKQAANETNDLKRQELQLKVDASQQALQDKQSQVQKGKDMSYEAVQLARSIADNPQLNVVTGSIQGRLPKFEGASLDIINQAQQLQSMLTAENLGLLKGAMSDKDIAFLKSMSSGLNVGDNGIKGSYGATKARLKGIADKLERGLGGYAPASQTQQATTKSWGDLP